MTSEPTPDRALEALLDDLEEALSRGLGDVAAHRLVGTARGIAALGADAGGRLAEGLLEYALEEKRLLVARAELGELGAAATQLVERAASLEQRVERLGRLAGKR